VVLESTTYPGTTRERLLPILEESGLAAGREFNLAYSPERIDPGRTDHTIRTTPKVVGGITEECCRRAVELYRLICDEVVEVSSPEVAELTKLLENIFRSVNIALVNELAALRPNGNRRLGLSTRRPKPFGFMRFEPGPGWAVIACRWIRSTLRSKHGSMTSTPSSSSWPGSSIRRSRSSAWRRSSAR
jgi:UDP-N-acetyl-D-glucosamine dehydrogenase